MTKWNGKYRAHKRQYYKGKWIYVRRCFAITKGSGGGYSGPHQCTLSVHVEFNGWPVCWIHLRQAMRKKEEE